MCASWAPATPGSPPPCGCTRAASRSWSSRRATGSAAGSGPSTCPTAPPIDRGGAWLAPRHEAMFGLARDFGVSDLQDLGQRRAPPRRRRPACCATKGLSRRSAPSPSPRSRWPRPGWTGASKRVPLDAPWTARRAAEWDARSVASWLERSGIRTAVARDLFDMAVRGLFTGSLDETSYLHLLFLIRAHGSINTLFSIKGGIAGEHDGGRRRARSRSASPSPSGTPCAWRRRCAPSPSTRTVSRSPPPTSRCRPATPWSACRPPLALDIAFDPVLPRRPRAPSTRAPSPAPSPRPSSSTTSRSGEPTASVARAPGPDRPPRSPSTLRRRRGSPASSPRSPSGHVAERRRQARRGRATARRPRRADGQVRAPGGITRRVHRDGVVDRAVDAGVLDGALPPGLLTRLRATAARALRAGALGRHRDLDAVARCHRRRRPVRASGPRRRSSIAGPEHGPHLAVPPGQQRSVAK